MILVHGNACKVQRVHRKCRFLWQDVCCLSERLTHSAKKQSSAALYSIKRRSMKRVPQPQTQQTIKSIFPEWLYLTPTYSSSLATRALTSVFSSNCPGAGLHIPQNTYGWPIFLGRENQRKAPHGKAWQAKDPRVYGCYARSCSSGGGWLYAHH